MDKQLVINIKTVLFIAALIVGSLLLVKIFPFLVLIYTALLSAIVLEPIIQYLSRQIVFNKPLSRITSILITYVSAALVLLGVTALIVPDLVSQLQLLGEVTIPRVNQTLGEIFNSFSFNADTYFNNLGSLTASVLGVFSGVFTALLGVAFSIYISMELPGIKRSLKRLPLGKYKEDVVQAIEDIELSIASWAKGQVILMLSVGSATTAGLLLLGGGSYALALGLLAGLLEFVPIAGPILTAIVAVIIYYPTSPVLAVAVIALFVVIQQLESNLLVPKVMQRVSGFNPLIILIAVTLGQQLLGVIGVLIAVPTFMIGSILAKRFAHYILPAIESE